MAKFDCYPGHLRRSADRSNRTRALEVGKSAEETAVRFLKLQGLSIVARNYRRRTGELDIVARTPDVLIIVEVRTRAGMAFGGAAASIGFPKRQRIMRTSAQLLQARKELARLPVRFDVIIVHGAQSDKPRTEWIQHAF